MRSILERELREQGPALASRTGPGWEDAARIVEILRREDVDHLLIAARGSSDNAARYAQYLLGSEARLSVSLAAPWLFGAGAPPRLSGAAVLAISQSGRSPDIVRVLAAARAQARPTIALTNDLDSPLAAGADALLPLRAGPERSVAATKTYLCSLHAIAQLAACLSAAPGVAAGAGLSAAGRDHDWFERLPDLVSRVVEEQLDARSRFDPLDPLSLLTVVGRGLQLATAHETALKVRELAGMATEAFSVPDLMHGPVAGLSSRGGIWLVSTHGRAAPDVPTLNDLRTRTGLVVAVADHEELLEAADIAVRVPDEVPDWVAPIVAVLPGQVAALRLGELRGVDLDRPHALSKVTLTR